MAAYNIKDIKDKKKLINLANYGTAERREMRPRVLIGAGKEKPFIEGDILDANATLNLIEDTYDKGRIFRSFSKEGKKIDKEIKELLEKTDENYEQLSSAIADNKEDADQKIDQLSSKVDNIESNIPNLRRVVDIQLQSVLDGTKTYLVTKQGDVQEQIQISDGEKGEQGEKGDPFTYEDFTPEQIEGLKVKGDRGISISSLEQTQTAYTSGGVNEFTVTLDDGTVSRWYVRNGQKGDATKIWVNANTVHSGYYDSDNHEIKLLNADGGIMSIIDATAFIKDGMISDAYVENGYIVIIFNTDAGQTPIMIPVTDIFDADDYYTKLDTDARIAEDVLVETQRAEAAEQQLTDDLAQEVSDRLSGDTTLDTKIETETTRATTAESNLGTHIQQLGSALYSEQQNRAAADNLLESRIGAEISRATAAEGLLDQRITSNSAAILAETTRATNAEEALSDAIDAEESTRIQEIDDLQDLLDAYIQSNDAAVQAEITRATTAEGVLQDNIDAEEQRAIAAELDLQDAIDAVEQGAGLDTAAVEQALNDEISRATLAEQLISSNLSAEITRATNADNANSTAISNEVSRATAAEQQNASDIDAIEALIPSLATSSNQLADKAFVNSSIATSTATFVGTFNDITDLYAVTTADANDYGYVITTDSAGNTKYNRYKYDGSQWDFEYALNNSSFTAEEWAAIQSGMTQALRIKLENLPSTAVTSVGVSVPTGLTVTGSPITSSGTIAINFTSGYSIPTTSSLTNWDTAYGWGNHANANYVKSVKVGTTSYNPSSGMVSLPAYPTTLPASDVYSWAKASTKPSYTLDEVTDGSSRKLSDYVTIASAQTVTGNKKFHGLAIFNNNAGGGWNEGVRCNLSSNSTDGWSSVVLGGAYDSTSGTGEGIWALCTNRKNFYFGHNGSSDATYGLSWGYTGGLNFKTSSLTNNNNTIWDAGNLTKVSQLTNDSGYVTSSGVTSVATGTGLTGGTITSTGTISINSTYQTYISHGESAYNSLANYLPLSGGTLTKATLSSDSGVLNINSTNAGNPFSYSIICNCSSLQSGYRNAISIGRTFSARNCGIMSFYWSSSGSNNNFLSFGQHSEDNILNLYGNGNVGIGMGTTLASQKLEVSGNVKASSFIKSDGTSSQFLKADGSVDSNTYATTTQLANYLPLTGGTLSGNLTIGNTTILSTGSDGGSNSLIMGNDATLGDCNIEGHFGVKAVSDTAIGIAFINSAGTQVGKLSSTTAGVMTWNNNTVWHAGNDGVGSGLDADTLDGLHADQFVYAHRGIDVGMATSGYWGAMSTQTGIDGNWRHVLSMDWVGSDTNNWISQLCLPTQDSKGVYYRSNQNGTSISNAVWIRLIDEDNIGSQSVSYATSAGKATNDSDGNAISSTYLKLSGGTVTGTTTFKTPSFGTQIEIYRNTTGGNPAIKFSNSNNIVSRVIGFESSAAVNKALYYTDDNYTNKYYILTDNNIGDYNAGSATKLATARTLWGQSFNGSANVTGDMSSVGNISLSSNKYICIGTSGEAGTNAHTGYISAGIGYSVGSGKYGLKILACDQADCQTGLGQDLATPTGWVNAYNFCVACGNSSLDYGYLSFVSHKVNSTAYRYLGGFCDNAGAVKFQVQGSILASGSVGIGTSNPSEKLDIVTSYAEHIFKNHELAIQEKTNGNVIARIGSGSSTPSGTNTYGYLQLYHAGTGMIRLYTANTSYINTNYNFGIGTDSPSYKLHVVGDAAATTIYENGTALSSKYAPISHTHSYLPTSGGTVSGNLTVSGTLTCSNISGAVKATSFIADHITTNSSASATLSKSNPVVLNYKQDAVLTLPSDAEVGQVIDVYTFYHCYMKAPSGFWMTSMNDLTSHTQGNYYVSEGRCMRWMYLGTTTYGGSRKLWACIYHNMG